MGRRGKSCSGTVHTEGEPTKASTTAVTKDSSKDKLQRLKQLLLQSKHNNKESSQSSSNSSSSSSDSSSSNDSPHHETTGGWVEKNSFASSYKRPNKRHRSSASTDRTRSKISDLRDAVTATKHANKNLKQKSRDNSLDPNVTKKLKHFSSTDIELVSKLLKNDIIDKKVKDETGSTFSKRNENNVAVSNHSESLRNSVESHRNRSNHEYSSSKRKSSR